MALHFHQLSLNYKKEAESFDGINLASQRAAHKCKQLVKRFNHEAVMCIMRKHSAKHQQSKGKDVSNGNIITLQFPADILDLHQLQVNEATQCLDLFLDHGIKQLRKTSDGTKKDLYVITGQGRHSLDGVPKIKLRTVEHLRERRLS